MCNCAFFKNKSVFIRNHHTQHRAAVAAARQSQGKTGHLESFNTVDTQQIVPGEDICGLCDG